jgi:hypothetical protein
MPVVLIINRKWRNGVGRLGSGGLVYFKKKFTCPSILNTIPWQIKLTVSLKLFTDSKYHLGQRTDILASSKRGSARWMSLLISRCSGRRSPLIEQEVTPGKEVL